MPIIGTEDENGYAYNGTLNALRKARFDYDGDGFGTLYLIPIDELDDIFGDVFEKWQVRIDLLSSFLYKVLFYFNLCYNLIVLKKKRVKKWVFLIN